MSFNRGTESWRRLSRFRRKSWVTPIEAEVLEPRCLLSHTTPHLPEYRVSLTDDFITGRPDLLNDAGLSVHRIGEYWEIVRTDSQALFMPPFLASMTAGMRVTPVVDYWIDQEEWEHYLATR